MRTMNKAMTPGRVCPDLELIDGVSSTVLLTGFSTQDGWFCGVLNKSTAPTDLSDLF
jgi:hypothetical protein